MHFVAKLLVQRVKNKVTKVYHASKYRFYKRKYNLNQTRKKSIVELTYILINVFILFLIAFFLNWHIVIGSGPPFLLKELVLIRYMTLFVRRRGCESRIGTRMWSKLITPLFITWAVEAIKANFLFRLFAFTRNSSSPMQYQSTSYNEQHNHKARQCDDTSREDAIGTLQRKTNILSNTKTKINSRCKLRFKF